MEFTELFTGIAIVLVMIIGIFGFIGNMNDEYGTTIGEEEPFNNTLSNVENLLESKFVDRGLDYAETTQPEPGQGSEGTQQDNMIKRALKSIGLIDDLIGLVPSLIKDASIALNIPQIYWKIGQALFWIIFAVTLAYLLLLGARRLA